MTMAIPNCTCVRYQERKTIIVRDPFCAATLLHELKANPRVRHETH